VSMACGVLVNHLFLSTGNQKLAAGTRSRGKDYQMFNLECPRCGAISVSRREKLSLGWARLVTCGECGETLGYPTWWVYLGSVLVFLFLALQKIVRVLGSFTLWAFTIFLIFLVLIAFTLWIPLVPVTQEEISRRKRWILPIGFGLIVLGILLVLSAYR